MLRQQLPSPTGRLPAPRHIHGSPKMIVALCTAELADGQDKYLTQVVALHVCPCMLSSGLQQLPCSLQVAAAPPPHWPALSSAALLHSVRTRHSQFSAVVHWAIMPTGPQPMACSALRAPCLKRSFRSVPLLEGGWQLLKLLRSIHRAPGSCTSGAALWRQAPRLRQPPWCSTPSVVARPPGRCCSLAKRSHGMAPLNL